MRGWVQPTAKLWYTVPMMVVRYERGGQCNGAQATYANYTYIVIPIAYNLRTGVHNNYDYGIISS